ncbi:MAG: tetraacyldisaccharide 4'-kinase [Bacteroidota bacterium]
MEFLRILLLPFALIYGLVTGMRNLLFDWKILPSERFNLPVISVGNLSAGGTGKTPHVEYLIRLLSPNSKVSTLSRGYGRKTHGFLAASDADYARTIGDEPMQYFIKYKDIKVYVDSHRRRGIKSILSAAPETGIILLDDAFQHRYAEPGLSILLTDYHKLYCNDYLIPAGTLREPISGASRADVIVVTKTPNVLSPIIRRKIIADLNPRAHQQIFFSFIRYGAVTSLWDQDSAFFPEKKYSHIVLFVGIANPYPLQDQLKKYCNDLTTLLYPDHFQYTNSDLDKIKRIFDELYSRNKLLVTTEKDAMRLINPDLMVKAMQMPIHYVPIEVEFHNGDKDAFNEQILNYVESNKGKCRLH